MAIYGYTKNYKLIKPQYDSDTWHDYEYDNLDTIDAVLSAIYASGNWKGFWAANTAYVVGDVVIDRDTDTMYKVMVAHTTSAGSFAAEQTAHPDYYELWSPNNLAESWAIKTDGKVSNEDYSAKAYAISSGLIDDGSAKEWAIGSGAIGNTNEYSAKKYATDAHNDYISMTTNPNVAAVGSNINNVNAVGQSISNVNTVASNVSSINTVATNISDVNTAATNIAAIQAAPTAASNAATSAQAAQDALNDVQGLIATPIGTIFQSIYVDESLDIARRLNGQLISSTKFTGFRSWLNTVQTDAPNLFTTETNWQAEKTNSKLGQCGKFVVDDTAGTIRLPCVVNAQGLVDLALIGGIKSESLPNITGGFGIRAGADSYEWSGAFNYSRGAKTQNVGGGSSQASSVIYNFNASRSSSTYQDNAPVQQEAVQYPYYIQVATGVEETLPAIREYEINTPFFFGKSMYSDVAPNNASWLASNGSYNARAVYPNYYDWLVEQMNAGVSGFVASTAAYTDYDFVVNQNDQTFRLPLLNGEENWVGNTSQTLSNADIVKETPFTWTATKNGFVKFTCYKQNTTQVVIARINGQILIHSGVATTTVTPRPGFWLKVRKGDTISISAETQTLSGVSITFIPAVGNGTLYYYVGDTVQDASLINAGAVLEQLSNIAAQSGNPTGTIIVWSATTPPKGYLVCNGAAISRTTYAALFNVIGTTWGAGDGSTTFNLPNLYLLSDIKVKGYTQLGLVTYSAPNAPSSNLGKIYRLNEPTGASGSFVMFDQNVQNQGIGLTSDVNSTGLAYEKTTFQTKFCIRY